MTLQLFEIADLLPQKAPFIMIDRLTHYDECQTKTELTVRDDNVFCHNGIMTETGLIENIAQTCAAREGYKEKTLPDRSGDIKIGFIGMLKSMTFYRCPRVGETLVTTAVIRQEIFDFTLVGANVVSDDEMLAEGELKIYLTEMK
ncbi:MAG: pseudouridylate synthase [Tannerella sp.]|jgi:predicted hotdog family 3-hydroxylacyl-ACP dehydratase|nr:pseudouridylate synthase [Tannerella sp.]